MNYMRIIFLLISATLFASCGGGGGSAGSNPNQPNLVTTAGDVLTIPAGAFREYAVSGGVPPYQVSSSEPAIAVGNINGSTLSIGALAGGKAAIRVFDFKGTSVLTDVTVGSSIPLYTTAPSSINIGVNVTRSFSVGGGAPPYTVVGSSSSVATVVQTDSTHWSITGVAANASGTVKIRDAAGASVEVGFSTTPPELRISPDKLTMPAGMEAQVTLSGGQPPYSPAGGIPAAIQVTPAVSTDGKFKIVGNLASKLDVTFVDSAGQSVKVEVEINTATVSFRLSPSPVSISENSIDDLTFSLFGFYGDSGTGASSGSVCIYVSDPRYFVLDSSRTTCSTFSSAQRTFKLVTGTRGNRCVSADTPIAVRVVDSQGSVASGTVTIVNNGTSCGGSSTGLSVTPSAVSVRPDLSSDVVVRGGDGRYTAVSSNLSVATVKVSGDIVTVTGGTASGVTTVTVIDADTGLSTTFSVTNGSGSGPGALTFSSTTVAVTPGLSNGVAVFGGSGSYFAATSNPAIATATVSGSTVTVTGGATRGVATVTVTDSVTGNSGTVNVTNGNAAGTLTFSPNSVTVAPGAANTVVISGGSGSYQATSSSPSVAIPAVSGSNLQITGGATRGTAVVTVVDTSTGNTGTVSVTNGNPAGVLTFSPNSVTVAPGAANTVVISGGSGSYQATSNSPSVAIPVVSGSNLQITGGATRGTAVVTVVDTSTGNTGTVSVTNGNAAGPLTFSPSAVALSPLLTSEVAISGGSGQYTVVSNNPVVATATVANSVLRVTGGSTRGTATVTVTDIVTGITGAVSVTNGNAAGALTFSPSSITVSPLLSSEVVISGGSGVYAVVSNSPNVATGSVSGSRLTVSGGSVRGTATLTVTDTATGTIGAVSVVNGNATGALTLSPVAVTVTPGTSNSIGVAGGSGSYIVASSNPFVATASVPLLFNNTVITVTGESARGTATITVTDSVTGLSATVTVTNGNLLGTLRVSPSIIYTTPSTSVTTVISGGSGDGNYRVSNVNSAIVETASISGVVATFTGGTTAGALTAVLFDVVTGDTATILVINNANNALVANPANIPVLAAGASLPVTISGGTGSYRVSSADRNIADITIVGQTATVVGVAPGATTVTATDTTTGRSVIIGVSVQ